MFARFTPLKGFLQVNDLGFPQKKGLSKFVMGRFMGLTKNVIWALGAKKNVVREVFAWQLSYDMRRGMNPSSDLSESHIKKRPAQVNQRGDFGRASHVGFLN